MDFNLEPFGTQFITHDFSCPTVMGELRQPSGQFPIIKAYVRWEGGDESLDHAIDYTKEIQAELARRWNAFEPDGEVAQLRAEVEQLRAALSALGPVEYEIPYHGIAWQPCSELNMDCKTKRAIRRVLGEGAA